jgi:hypothetical protein
MGKEGVGCEEWKMTEASTEDIIRRMEELVSVDRKIRIIGVMYKLLDIFGEICRLCEFQDVK